MKERAAKGDFWFLFKNSFYDSLMFNQQIYEPNTAGPSYNSGYTVAKESEVKSFVDENEAKPAGPKK